MSGSDWGVWDAMCEVGVDVDALRGVLPDWWCDECESTASGRLMLALYASRLSGLELEILRRAVNRCDRYTSQDEPDALRAMLRRRSTI